MSDAPRQHEFRELFRQHAPFVWRVLRRHGVAPADLEDVCQEVFTVVHRRLSEFEGRSSFRTWLYEVARRSALAQRRRAARLATPGEFELAAADDDAPDRRVDRQRALAWLHWALTQLDEEKREAFVLYELEQLTLAEVASAMLCSINAVHYRVLSARRELSKLSRRSGGPQLALHECEASAAAPLHGREGA